MVVVHILDFLMHVVWLAVLLMVLWLIGLEVYFRLRRRKRLKKFDEWTRRL